MPPAVGLLFRGSEQSPRMKSEPRKMVATAATILCLVSCSGNPDRGGAGTAASTTGMGTTGAEESDGRDSTSGGTSGVPPGGSPQCVGLVSTRTGREICYVVVLAATDAFLQFSARPGDFNGNGLSDFVGQDSAGGRHFFLAGGDGSFADGGLLGIPFPDRRHPRILDFDHDGIDDLAYLDGSNVVVYRVSEDAVPEPVGEFPGESDLPAEIIVEGDWDDDGWTDIMGLDARGAVTVWRNNSGQGLVASASGELPPLANYGFRPYRVADADADGDDDVAFVHEQAIAISEDGGAFRVEEIGSALGALFGDVSGDARADSVALTAGPSPADEGPYSPYASVSLRVGSGFEEAGHTEILVPTGLELSGTGPSSLRHALADIDEDGSQEVILGTPLSPTGEPEVALALSVLSDRNGGEYGHQAVILLDNPDSTVWGVAHVFAANVSDDGVPDFIVGGQRGDGTGDEGFVYAIMSVEPD